MRLISVAVSMTFTAALAACADQLPSSPPAESHPVIAQRSSVRALRFRINRAVTGSTQSMLVTYSAQAPADRVDVVMALSGVRLGFDSPGGRRLSVEVAKSAIPAVRDSLRLMTWVEKVVVLPSNTLRASGVVAPFSSPSLPSSPCFLCYALRMSDLVPWGVHFANADRVQDASYFDNSGWGIKVGVIDAGIDCSLTGLSGKVYGGYDYADSSGYDCSYVTAHGTAVASIIAASGGGLLGTAPGVHLYSYRTFTDDSIDHPAYVAAALAQARTDGMQVINLSIGDCGRGRGPDLPSVWEQIDSAVAAGIVVVAAAGDGNGPGNPDDCSSTDSISSLAVRPGVVAVGAVNRDSGVSAGYQSGPEMTVVAPDSVTVMRAGTGAFAIFDGTSAAAPHVAGAIAQLLYAGDSPALAIGALKYETQTKPDSGNRMFYDDTLGHNNVVGYGTLDVAGAVNRTPQIWEFESTCDGVVHAGDTCEVTPLLGLDGYAPVTYTWHATATAGGTITVLDSSSAFEFRVNGDSSSSFTIGVTAWPHDTVTPRHPRVGEPALTNFIVCPGGGPPVERPTGGSDSSPKTFVGTAAIRSLSLGGRATAPPRIRPDMIC